MPLEEKVVYHCYQKLCILIYEFLCIDIYRSHGALNISSQFLKQSLGLDSIDSKITYQEYFRTATEKKISSFTIDEVSQWPREKLIAMLEAIIGISNTLGYKSIVVLFDKIDEFQAINGDIEKITDFTIEILTDTELLLYDNLAIVFSLWSEIKRSLNRRGVRFDKFNEIDIRWRKEQLTPLIDTRLYHFSKDKVNPVKFETLVSRLEDRNLLIELSDKSPRSLIRLLGTIYNRQENHNEIEFSSTAISKGVIEYCEKFDYESLQPSVIGKYQYTKTRK